MTEEQKVNPAAEADAVANATESQAAPEAKPATETPAPAKDIRERMFGDKIKRNKPSSEEKKPEGESPTDAKLEETPKANAQEQQPELEQRKKGAKERIQELARGNKALKEEAALKDSEIARLSAELEKLKGVKDEDKSQKDWAREVYLEDKLAGEHGKIVNELQDYVSKHQDPEAFETNYDYYMPIFNNYDPFTVNQILKYPEKIAMFDKLYEAITNGAFTMQEWINSPQPLKLLKIKELRSYVNGSSAPATPQTPAPAQKQVPDSIKPVVSNKTSEPFDSSTKGSTFKKVFEAGIRPKT